MNKIKIYSLTDISNKELVKNGLFQKPLVIWKYVLAPGEVLEVEDEPLIREQIKAYVALGAMALGELPASYTVAKAKIPKKRGKKDGT